jgi:hypothetical protein
MVAEIADDKEGLNVKAALCVGFAAFLRSGEFTWTTWTSASHRLHLSRKHVTFEPDGSVALILPSSKTDPYHVGTTIYLARSLSSTICPVRALPTLLSRYPAHPDAPLFIRPFCQPFTKSFFVFAMQCSLLNAGISMVGYSGHSLRKGAAVTADRNGVSRQNIQLLGRWKSDSVDVYIDEGRKSDQARKMLHLNAKLLSPTSKRQRHKHTQRHPHVHFPRLPLSSLH